MDREITLRIVDRLADEIRQSRREQPDDPIHLAHRERLWVAREKLRLGLLQAD
jgi:hypothetical protein